MTKKIKRSGYIAIVGKPNVGKSTLLNALLHKKISITSRKPQTTRHSILGIKTKDEVQMLFVDTPGLHSKEPRALNRYMNKAARSALSDVDIILFVVDSRCWDEQDQRVLELLKKIKSHVFLVINKVDQLKDRKTLLPFIESISHEYPFTKIIPLSAKNGEQVSALEHAITEELPEGEHYFLPEQVTDRSDTFIASEIIREKLMRYLGQEVPYALTVTIDLFKREERLLTISAIIWVERKGQKAIVIGKEGENLKEIGKKARLDMEKYFGQKVFLKLWIKVKDNWSDDEFLLTQLGYDL